MKRDAIVGNLTWSVLMGRWHQVNSRAKNKNNHQFLFSRNTFFPPAINQILDSNQVARFGRTGRS